MYIASFTFLIVFLYLCVFLVSLVQILRIFWYRHRMLGYQGIFLMICLLWAATRAFFFLFLEELQEAPLWSFFLMYWLPINIQFATYSLLIVFYASALYKTTETSWWERTRTYIFGFYLTVNFCLLCFTIAAVIMTVYVDTSTEIFDNSWENFVSFILNAVVFTLMSLILGYYSWIIAPLVRQGKVKIPFQPQRSSNVNIVVVTVIVFFIFTSRAIFDIVSAFGAVTLTITDGWSWTTFLVFFLFFLWEIIPAMLIIMLFWRIPGSSRVHIPLLSSTPSINHNYDVTEHTLHQHVHRHGIFDNPMRYDSPPDVEPSGGRYGPPGSVPRQFSLGRNSPYSPYDTTSPHSLEKEDETRPMKAAITASHHHHHHHQAGSGSSRHNYGGDRRLDPPPPSSSGSSSSGGSSGGGSSGGVRAPVGSTGSASSIDSSTDGSWSSK